MTMYSGIVALVAVWFWLWSVVDAAVGEPTRFVRGSRRLWIMVCLLLPILGATLYLAVGRRIALPSTNISEPDGF
jgi:hypothetical protein